MGCATQKSSKALFSKADLIELQKHPEELHEKRMKILRWMEDDVEFQLKNNTYPKSNSKKIEENEQLLSWQEAWAREQELVQHPSMIDTCQSKISCITLINENLRLPRADEVTAFWSDFEKALRSSEDDRMQSLSQLPN
jgi:hypothetical protein